MAQNQAKPQLNNNNRGLYGSVWGAENEIRRLLAVDQRGKIITNQNKRVREKDGNPLALGLVFLHRADCFGRNGWAAAKKRVHFDVFGVSWRVFRVDLPPHGL